MLSRRVFLLSAFVAPGLSLLQRTAIGKALDTSKVLVLTENNCLDTSAFAACLPSTYIETDPTSVLLELDSSFREGEYDMVFGLTRDSNFVLVEQYAQSASYQLCYQGVHQYNSRGLSHKLRAEKNVVSQLSELIKNESKDWSQLISRVPVLSNYNEALMVSAELQTEVSSPEHSPGQLVSWLFKRDLS